MTRTTAFGHSEKVRTGSHLRTTQKARRPKVFVPKRVRVGFAGDRRRVSREEKHGTEALASTNYFQFAVVQLLCVTGLNTTAKPCGGKARYRQLQTRSQCLLNSLLASSPEIWVQHATAVQ